MEIDHPIKMRVASQQVCLACGQKGKYDRTKGSLICICGKFAPTLLEVELIWNRKRVRITADENGRWISGYLDAINVLQKVAQQVREKTFDPADWKSHKHNRLLWPRYLDEYLERQKQRLFEKSRASYDKQRALAKHLRPAFSGSVKEIRTAHVQDFFNNPTLTNRFAPKTIQDLALELRFIFKDAVAREIIAKAPQVPIITVPEKPIEWMTWDQQQVALEKIPDRHHPIFEFLFMYGCRVSEALALCWDAVDRDKGLFWIKRTFSRRKLQDVTKTSRAYSQPIHPEFETILDKLNPAIGRTPVFVNPDADRSRNRNGFYSGDFLNKIWAKALEEAGLNHIRLQNAARHSLAMQMTHAGLGENVIARQLNHTSTVHVRKYARVDNQVLRNGRKVLIADIDKVNEV